MPRLDRRAVRHRAAALLHRLLSMMHKSLGRPLEVRRRDNHNQAVLSLRKREAPLFDERLPGMFFSPLELLIWRALEAGPLKAAQIAAALNRDYDHHLKVLLPNLVDRKVITHDERGYQRAPAPGTRQAG